jgi:hypothetical protein
MVLRKSILSAGLRPAAYPRGGNHTNWYGPGLVATRTAAITGELAADRWCINRRRDRYDSTAMLLRSSAQASTIRARSASPERASARFAQFSKSPPLGLRHHQRF